MVATASSSIRKAMELKKRSATTETAEVAAWWLRKAWAAWSTVSACRGRRKDSSRRSAPEDERLVDEGGEDRQREREEGDDGEERVVADAAGQQDAAVAQEGGDHPPREAEHPPGQLHRVGEAAGHPMTSWHARPALQLRWPVSSAGRPDGSLRLAARPGPWPGGPWRARVPEEARHQGAWRGLAPAYCAGGESAYMRGTPRAGVVGRAPGPPRHATLHSAVPPQSEVT